MNFPKRVNVEFPKREMDMPTALMGVLSRLQNQMANLGSSFAGSVIGQGEWESPPLFYSQEEKGRLPFFS
jgi:hypothetical protein